MSSTPTSPKRRKISVDSFYENSDIHDVVALHLLSKEDITRTESKAQCAEFTSFRYFKKQSQAVEHVSFYPFLKLFSEEIDISDEDAQRHKGIRRYIAETYENFWKIYSKLEKPSFYEIIQEDKACSLYFDIDCKKDSIIEYDPLILLEDLLQFITKQIDETFSIHVIRKDIIDMDSSTDDKFSRHIVIPKCTFQNNIDAGNFVLSIIERLNSLDIEYYNKIASMIDSGVYSKNRNFRLFLSSKVGKTAKLVRSKEYLSYHPFESDKQFFMKSLICNIPKDICEKDYLTYNEHTTRIKYNIKYTERRDLNSAEYSSLEQYLLSQLRHRPGKFEPTLKSCVIFDSNCIVYNIGENRFCENIGREHQSNHIKIIVNLERRVFFQKWYVYELTRIYSLTSISYDPDCAIFKGNEYPIPLNVFLPVFTNEYDNDLIDCVEKFEKNI